MSILISILYHAKLSSFFYEFRPRILAEIHLRVSMIEDLSFIMVYEKIIRNTYACEKVILMF